MNLMTNTYKYVFKTFCIGGNNSHENRAMDPVDVVKSKFEDLIYKFEYLANLSTEVAPVVDNELFNKLCEELDRINTNIWNSISNVKQIQTAHELGFAPSMLPSGP